MNNTKIKYIHARQVMDCKFRPVLEVAVELENGKIGYGSAPTGGTIGEKEVIVLRDNGTSFCGMSVYDAIENVEKKIAPLLIGMDVADQKAIDEIINSVDNSDKKENIGGNATYSVSMACLSAATESNNMQLYKYVSGNKELKTLPIPFANTIMGGKYLDKTVSYQEFLFAPYKVKNMEEAMRIIYDVHHEIGKIFTKEQGGIPAERGNGHAWKPPVADTLAIMEMMHMAVSNCGYKDKVAYAIDLGASEMYNKEDNTYFLDGKYVNAHEYIEHLDKLSRKYNIIFVEDILDQNAWSDYIWARKKLDKVSIIGDDFTVSNLNYIKKANELGIIDGFILKPSQVATVTDAINSVEYAKNNGLSSIVSLRNGGTIWDNNIDLGVGLQINCCKSCAPCGGEGVYAMNCLYRAYDENKSAVFSDISNLIHF